MYALTAVLALVLVINVITAFLSVTDTRRELGWLPFALLCVQGDSMEPVLSDGDLILVQEIPFEALSIGDDITFWGTDGFVTHRIVDAYNGAYMTRGLANDVEDFYTVRPETYCGKVIFALPYMGYAQEILVSSTLVILICALIALAVCFAGLLRLRLRGRAARPAASRRALAARVISFCGMISMLLTLPYVTEAKYTGQVNRYELGVARPFYFTSNYLSEGDGNTYNIQGWNGKAYTLNLDMRNYSNSLLYNPADLPVRFGFGVRIKTDEEYSDDYTITITPPAGTTPLEADEFHYPEEWADPEQGITTFGAYSIAGNDTEAQSLGFSLLITPKTEGETTEEDPTLSPNTRIQFEVFAVTDSHQTYFVELCATFRFRVSETVQFIGNKTEVDLPSMINLSVLTNNVNDGNNEKIVVFKWDPNLMYINEFQSTAFSVINNNPEYYDREQGILYIKMQAYSRVDLEFFKKTAFTPGENGAIVVEVVDAIGKLPTAEPDVILPTETPDGSGS